MRTMTKRTALTTATTLALSLSAFGGTAAMAATPTAVEAPVESHAVSAAAPADLGAARQVILDETNAARAAAGLPALTADAELDAIAQSCAEWQAANGVMAHCDDFASKYPAGWTLAAENVASGQSLEDVVDAWLASPGHQANILQPETTHIGIGYAVGSDGRTYFTQDFAAYPAGVRPGAEQPAPEQPAPEKAAFDRDRLLQEIRDRIAASGHPFAMEIAASI